MRFHAILLLAAAHTAESLLRAALVSPGKAVSVSIEYSGAADAIDELSQELRKAKAAAIWCDDVDAVKCFANEQATAKGDFPGPLPVVYTGADRQAATDAGAAAVVADAGEDVSVAPVIWRVTADNAAGAAAAAGEGDAFLFDADATAAVVAALPAKAVAVASLNAMQEDEAEVEAGRACRDAGAAGVLLRRACVGDDEDIKYARHAVGLLRSKRSSSFAMDGFTGSTNGHFGTSYGGADKPKAWKRQQVAA
ncbi:unnamed protein product [Pelagomonas calceolata]|uniref:Indole-3-glycerol-phosphate synthase n=1 Tax=Pelagomonas calceolata TaxID=35677 RepID=A0A8J2X1Q3_9STRA|nr:unnamed protein product [Pelagomonas calceolata]